MEKKSDSNNDPGGWMYDFHAAVMWTESFFIKTALQWSQTGGAFYI